MIIVEIEENAGIGNQMFQYAHAYALAEKYDQKILIVSHLGRADNVREYMLNRMNLDKKRLIGTIRVDWFNFLQFFPFIAKKNALNRAFRFVLRVTANGLIKSGLFELHTMPKVQNRKFGKEQPLQKGKNYYVRGFFESYRYFDEYRMEIQRQFRLQRIPCEVEKCIYKIENTNSVAVHIRRGDFTICGRLLPISYYDHAIQYLEKELKHPEFFILCEDEEVREHYRLWQQSNLHIIDVAIKNRDVVEWYLISRCKHHVITNSTYSWWSAYVSDREGKRVFIPDADLYLSCENADIYVNEKYGMQHYTDYFLPEYEVLPKYSE